MRLLKSWCRVDTSPNKGKPQLKWDKTQAEQWFNYGAIVNNMGVNLLREGGNYSHCSSLLGK